MTMLTDGNTETEKQGNGTRDKNKGEDWKLATWNVRGLSGKEHEIWEECKKYKIDILGITETKKKGQGMVLLQDHSMLIHSGIAQNQRAKAGVGCLISKEWAQKVCRWEYVSERLLLVTIMVEQNKEIAILVAYGPNEDEKVDVKEKFWEEISNVKESVKNPIVIIGDLNGRVGKKDANTVDVIGTQGEDKRNDNGCRLIKFCIDNDMIIANTFFTHKEIHKITREIKSRREKSVIDYIITERPQRSMIKDVKVCRGAEVGSDHYMLVARIKKPRAHINLNKNKEKYHEKVKLYKLKDPEYANSYRNAVEHQIEQLPADTKQTNVEEMWQITKNIMMNAAKAVCGTAKINQRKKQTAWWSQELRMQIKRKKQKWNLYLHQKTQDAYQDYKRQREIVKKLVKEAKTKNWEEFGKKMEKNSKENQKLFYKVLKNLRGTKEGEIKQIKTKDGKLLTCEDEIIDRWREHFEELLNPADGGKKRTHSSTVAVPTENDHAYEEDIELQEVAEAIKIIKKGKSAGDDGVTSEMIKCLGEKGVQLLADVCKKAWTEKRVPCDWQVGVIVPIYKKGDRMNCQNYRGITLLSIAGKVYERIIEKRLRKYVESDIADSQSGFRKGHSIQDHIFTLKQMINKTLQKGTELYIAFIDLEKAFDSIGRWRIWECLQNRKIDTSLIEAIKSFYKNTKNYVRYKGTQSKEFITEDGLRQGAVLSPLLFILAMDEMIKLVKTQISAVTAGYLRLQPITVTECAFADDLTIFGMTELEIKRNLEKWSEVLKEYGMKMNIGKTKVMVISRKDKKVSVTCEGQAIEQVNTIKYLGVVIDNKGQCETETNERMAAAGKLYNTLSRSFISKKEVSKTTKTIVYKTLFRPVLTFGSESWVLNKRQKQRIQAMEMKYHRRTMGVTRMDRQRNDDIRKDLNVKPILETLEENQLKWFGHMVRMTDERQVKRIWEARIQTNRTRGRPRETWNEAVSKVIKKRGLTWREAMELAQNKKSWSKFVYKNEM